MPRHVDHDQRRRELSDAVWRVVSDHGLEGLTLRTVAAEAGCSTGRAAHYFRDKAALLAHARDVMHRRMTARIDALPAQPNARARLRSVVAQGLPLDADRRLWTTVWAHFLLAARTDPALLSEHSVRHRSWIRRVTGLLRDAYAETPSGVPTDLDLRVLALIAAVDGLALNAVANPDAYPADLVERILDTQIALLLNGVDA
jgi:AcrR family transcriptional regulator